MQALTQPPWRPKNLGALLCNKLGLGMKPAFGESGCSVACLEWVWRITVSALYAIGRSS